MTAATTERIDRPPDCRPADRSVRPTGETFHLELKPLADPRYRREGIRHAPIKRLKRLLKFAGRACGFRIRWGRSPSPVELTDAEQAETPMIRFTDGPAAGRTLMLQRAPLFLRVTYDPNRLKWDALDPLTDTPIAPEQITVYRRVGEPSAAYLDWTENGRRRGGPARGPVRGRDLHCSQRAARRRDRTRYQEVAPVVLGSGRGQAAAQNRGSKVKPLMCAL